MKYLVEIYDGNERSGSYWIVSSGVSPRRFYPALTTAELNALLNGVPTAQPPRVGMGELLNSFLGDIGREPAPPEPPKVGTWLPPQWVCEYCWFPKRQGTEKCSQCHTIRPPLPDDEKIAALEAKVARLREALGLALVAFRAAQPFGGEYYIGVCMWCCHDAPEDSDYTYPADEGLHDTDCEWLLAYKRARALLEEEL